jgi:2,4-dienoyl-CoA reductase-like NADH-dependent reductase (Old Yellow Enzyme family)/thioredoxin reductase
MSKKLFTPIKLGNVEIKNRIIFSSVCAHYCEKDGSIGPRMWNYVEERAKGGTGLLIIPGSPHGKVSPGRPALSDDSYIPGWAKMADMVHTYGAKLFCQLHPAAMQAGRGFKIDMPADYDKELIGKIVASYAECARRAQKAGVDGVEIHGAHAHEVAQFMSPHYNERTDEYGGSLENRARFPIQIIKAIKAACGKDFPVVFRISGNEMIPGGRVIEDSVKLAKLMEEAGADAIHVSSGMPESEQYISAPMDVPDGFNVDNAAAVKAAVKIPVVAVNRIVDIEQANEIIEQGKADMTAMTRAQLCDPELVNKRMGKNKRPARLCVGCNQGCRMPEKYKDIRCMQNPRLGFEYRLNFESIPDDRKDTRIMIVGAGPAGLEAACDLADRGFSPVVYDESSEPGGLLKLAQKPPFKANIKRVIDYRVALADMLGVKIHYGKKIELEDIRKEAPDVLVIATGSLPNIPPIPGIEGAVTGDDVLRGAEVKGRKVAVLGGGLIGVETAEYLAAGGKEVVVFEQFGDIAAALTPTRKVFLLERMDGLKIERRVNTKIQRIALPEIIVSSEDKEETLDGFEAVVAAAGRVAQNKLANEVKENFPNMTVFVVGDASAPGLALDAIYSAAEAAAAI